MDSYPKIDYTMEREGLDKVCPYSTAKGRADPANPHNHEDRDHTKKILDDITDYVGNTPMVRLANIAKNDNIKCELCNKSNMLNSYSGKV